MKNLNINKTNSLLAVAFMAFGGLFLQSCEESALQGCTDADSINYDALAEEDDGTCAYEADKFLGIYVGPLDCPNYDLLSNEAGTMEITKGLYSTTDSVKVAIVISNVPLPLAGKVEGSRLIVLEDVNGLPFISPTDSSIVVLNVNVDADLTLSDDKTILSGNMKVLAVIAETGAIFIDTDCTYDGDKQ